MTYNYCKPGYFRWGNISRKCWQDISRGGNFHDTTPISFIKAYGFYFRMGEIFAKNTKVRKMWKLPPRENFHVYSTHYCDINNVNMSSFHLHEGIQIHWFTCTFTFELKHCKKHEMERNSFFIFTYITYIF